jgi:hypothetical protein
MLRAIIVVGLVIVLLMYAPEILEKLVVLTERIGKLFK